MITNFFLLSEIFLIPGIVIGYFLGKYKAKNIIEYKFIGIVFISMISWLLSQTKLISWWNISFILFLLCSIFLVYKIIKIHKIKFSNEQIKIFIFTEIISFLIYNTLNYLRTFNPDITGTEKFMDMMIINALTKSPHIPIENPWMQGVRLNYYYYGQYIIAFISKLSDIHPVYTYNLGISLVATWIFQTSIIFASLLKLSFLRSVIATIITYCSGNFYILYSKIFKPQESIWFASATRVIPKTINEFPAFTILLGDLHGHYLALPFFILGIYYIFLILHNLKKCSNYFLTVLFALIFTISYLSNSWDTVVLAEIGLILTIYYILKYIWGKPLNLKEHINTFVQASIFLIIFMAIYLNSKSFFIPAVRGVGFTFTNYDSAYWFILFGHFVTMMLLLVPKILKVDLKRSDHVIAILLVIIGFLNIVIVRFFYLKEVFETLNYEYRRANTLFKIYSSSWTLIFIPLIKLFWDIKLSRSRRIFLPRLLLNAVFIINILITLYYFYFASRQYILGPNKITYDSIKEYIFEGSNKIRGDNFIRNGHGEDYIILNTLNRLTKNRVATMLEATDYNSYLYYARMSVFSGNTTVMGWPLHNVQWHGGYKGKAIQTNGEIVQLDIARQTEDAKIIYTGKDIYETQRLISKYRIEYIIIGDQEIEHYNKNKEEINYALLQKLCPEIVHKNNQHLILKCNLNN